MCVCVCVCSCGRGSPEVQERGRQEHSQKAVVSFLHDLVLVKMYFIVVACNVLLNLPDASLSCIKELTLDGDIVQIKMLQIV